MYFLHESRDEFECAACRTSRSPGGERAPDGPLVLAVAPDLTLTAVMRAREQTAASDITVTTLDERWLAILKEKFK